MSTQIAQTARGPIEYRREGAGPAVLVLNGGHCSRDTRLSHERLAEAGFTVVTPSRPGYDATPAAVGPTAQAAADALAALLDSLDLATVSVIGISAAGPTALALAQRHPTRVARLVLESAVTMEWDPALRRKARLIFGRAERLTWAVLKLALRLQPAAISKMMLREFTTLDVEQVWGRMGPADRLFLQRMLRSMRSGAGFVLDLEHRVGPLDALAPPVLVMYSPHDGSVAPANAERVAREAPRCELYEVPADSHLIWIGPAADEVWRRRLAFLRAEWPATPAVTTPERPTR